VTTSPAPSSGAGAVADPRIAFTFGENSHRNKFKVADWDDPAPTVMGATRPGSGAPSIADPRFAEGLDVLRVKKAYDHGYGVLRQDEPSSTVAGGSMPGQGAYAVADDRYRGTYGVLSWEEMAPTVTGNARPTTGAFSVADLRFKCKMRSGTYGVMSWQAAAATIRAHHTVDNAPAAVADPRFPHPKKPPTELQIIISADGTWHRPITTYELAALQSLPLTVNGEPLKLDGDSSGAWRERIGNAVPRKAATAIAQQMLVCLMQAELGGFSLASDATPVWISPAEERCDA
jgi:site-specific DNA-cytosine methylase